MEEREERYRNPFLDVCAFRDAQAFFGREQEIQLLCRLLYAGESVSIVAESGQGKTSFLRWLWNCQFGKRLSSLPLAEYIWLPVQLCMSRQEAEKYLMDELPARRAGQSFLEQLRELLRERRLLLLLDDITVILNDRTGMDFLIWLKNIRTIGVQLVVTMEATVRDFPQRSKAHKLFCQQLRYTVALGNWDTATCLAFLRHRMEMNGYYADLLLRQWKQEYGEYAGVSPAQLEQWAWKRFEEIVLSGEIKKKGRD